MGQQQLLQMSHLVPQQGYLVLRDKSERTVRSQKDEPFTQNKAHYITKPGGGDGPKFDLSILLYCSVLSGGLLHNGKMPRSRVL